MGYSCTKAADDTLQGMMKFSRAGESNTWRDDRGTKFFYEIGREHADGAITGSIMKFINSHQCIPAGNFRINPNGSVARFPHINKAMRKFANTMK